MSEQLYAALANAEEERDQLKYALVQRDEQLRSVTLDRDRFRADFQTQADWIAEWKRVAGGLESQVKDLKHEHVTDMIKADLEIGELRQQLSQAQESQIRSNEALDLANQTLYQNGLIGVLVDTINPIGWLSPDEAAKLQAQCDSLHRELVSHREKAHGNYWAWQNDGEDRVESLVCPVLIHAHDMKSLLDRLAKAEKLLINAIPSYGYDGHWYQDRDAFLAQQKGPSREKRTGHSH